MKRWILLPILCVLVAMPALAETRAAETRVIELPAQKVVFQPSRDDITVGCAVLAFFAREGAILPEAVSVNGMPLRSNMLYLKQVGKNEFALPALKITFSSEGLRDPLYLSLKVWFNELTNQYDSPFYQRTPDRYALVSYCSDEDEDPAQVNARLGANRARTLEEFRARLAQPFVIELRKTPLQELWGRFPMTAGMRVSADELKAIEQPVRDKGERFLITVVVNGADRATVLVGDNSHCQVARTYKVARAAGRWRVESVEDTPDWSL